MARRSNIRVPIRRARKFKGWSGLVDATATATLPAASVVLDQALVPQVAEQTILRIRGGIFVVSDQITGREFQLGALGVGVVTEAAATVGVTAVPDPLADSGDELWMLWQAFGAGYEVQTGVGFGRVGNWYPFDTKAMRKVSNSDRLVFVLSNASATYGLDYWIQGRILSLLN